MPEPQNLKNTIQEGSTYPSDFLLEIEKEIEGKMFGVEKSRADKILSEVQMQMFAHEGIMDTFYSEMQIRKTIRKGKVLICPSTKNDVSPEKMARIQFLEQKTVREIENTEILEGQMNTIRERDVQCLKRVIEKKFEKIKSTCQNSHENLSSMKTDLYSKMRECEEILEQLQEMLEKMKASIKIAEKTSRDLRALASSILIDAGQKIIDEQNQREESWRRDLKTCEERLTDDYLSDIEKKIEALDDLLDRYRDCESYPAVRRILKEIDYFVRKISKQKRKMENLENEMEDNKIKDIYVKLKQVNSEIEQSHLEEQFHKINNVFELFKELKKEVEIWHERKGAFDKKMQNWEDLIGIQRKKVMERCHNRVESGNKCIDQMTGAKAKRLFNSAGLSAVEACMRFGLGTLQAIDLYSLGARVVFYGYEEYKLRENDKRLISNVNNIIELIDKI